ncbi:glycoside hydrolase family 57 protein [Marinobacter daepoensis]|uniref:glycoside hydrolase family 57 protein n=1 Tax=Marinobacter daepoensis TaxID=262077 RepID=UPI00041F1206|nr:glycoside hydrolase family 57 protein [Marinobacter daepoensis]
MASENTTPVVLCWHMHQPDYQNHKTGEFLFPWVYLHCLKDYVDMAAHLEHHPGAKAVVNFAPVLLEQIEDYLLQIERWRHDGPTMGDPLLAALVAPTLPTPGSPAFLALIDKCLRANKERIIKRFPAYARLADVADLYRTRPDLQRYLSAQFLADLLVWYHLGWMAETVRRTNAVVQGLQEKSHNYTLEDRRALLDVIAELMSSLGPRYRHLAQKGQIELSMSPWGHPILPLLLDFGSARESLPDITLPEHPGYPGGRERAIWHLNEGRKTFERFFGMAPRGCWASEGGLSQATLALLSDQGILWTASGDSVIHNSLRYAASGHAGPEQESVHQPYRFGEASVTAFFRDDGLSDRIGFSYADWHAKDAVGDLVHHMEAIAREPGTRVISVILDGENAWEYYPENGFHFLDELYEVLERHPKLRLTTYTSYLEGAKTSPAQLPELVAGSWIYGTFSTWIGDPDKNRAWDLLCDAKQQVDRALDNEPLSADQKEAALRQLGLCEGSDWFWWFGDYNPAPIVQDFEQLYRRHLVNLYERIGCEAPANLFQPMSQGGGAPAKGGAMRPGHEAEL